MAFSFPAGSDPGQQSPGGDGTGDHGEKWDPNSQRWIPLGQAGNMPAPAAPRPMGAGGISSASGNPTNGWINNGNGDQSSDPGATLGKVRPFGGAGSWGGYSGTMVDDGNGGARYDAGMNGRREAVDRARGLGDAAASQRAYQINYGQADSFAGAGQDDRRYQADAMNLSRDTAMGHNMQSQALGQSMLRQGLQAQQAGASSTRGGALAQAAAMRQQAAGQGSFMQQGNTQLEAQRASEMAQGREQYMNQATGMRASDAQAQGLNQQQGIQQMQQELGQRQLGQQGQLGYEAQGQAVNKAASDAAQRVDEMNHGIDSAAMLRGQQRADRELQMGAAAAQSGGALIAQSSGAFSGTPPPPQGGAPGGYAGEAKPYDPYSNSVSNSDVRGKTNITSLATAAMMRRGMR